MDFTSLYIEELSSLMRSMHLSVGSLIAGLIFGVIGILAFRHGSRKKLRRPQIIGIALMLYPSFVFGTLPVIAVGLALTAALYFRRKK